MNKHKPILWVLPIASKVKNYKGHPILNPKKEYGIKEASEILVFQLKAIAKERLLKKIGVAPQQIIDECRNTINNLIDY